MSKVISYALFNNPNKERWLFYTYFRGLVWNVKMNQKIYPSFRSHIEVESKVFSDFDNIFFGLKDLYGATITINETMPLCKGMLTRLKPMFEEDTEILLTRDSDAITTYREAVAIDGWMKWGNEKNIIFTLKDNPGHTLEIMGGMTAYECSYIRKEYGTWDNLLAQSNIPLDAHGSDQQFLMQTIYKDFHNEAEVWDMRSQSLYHNQDLDGVDKSLWTSNLIPAFIGAAGVNNMEYLRFEKDHLKNEAFEKIEKSYPEIFYHHTL